MIYLGSPYSHQSAMVRKLRYEATASATAHFIKQGMHIFSPIVYCHQMAIDYELPTEATFWQGFDEAFLSRSQQFWILKLPGYEDSKGLITELELALTHNIFTQHISPDHAGVMSFATALQQLA